MLGPENIEQRTYKHGTGFLATCPNCKHRKRMIDIRGVWWFICRCGYQVEIGNIRAVLAKLAQ